MRTKVGRIKMKKITYQYALNLSVLLASAEGTGWDHEETDPDWWRLHLYFRRN